MKLINLKLINFKGIKNFELRANGQNISIFGDNATGKTTIFDAFNWLLFDKDSTNKKDFDIKTLDDQNQPVHGLEHEVEAHFQTGDNAIQFRKVFYEKWTKKRGAATAEFTGHTTDYFINSVPVKNGEYQAKIREIADEDIFKLLTSPTYFNNQLHWQERRKILLEVCGDVGDGEVIASNKSLKRLPDILQGRTIEEQRKVIAARRTKINDELQKIPVRISEVSQSLPDLSNLIPEELPADIGRYTARIEAKQNELALIKNGGEIAEKTKQLRQVEAELLKIENEFKTALDAQVRQKRKLLNQLEDEAASLRRGMVPSTHYSAKIESIQKQIDKLNLEAEAMRKEWAQVNAEQFEFDQDDKCPTCGQYLPEEHLKNAREKALADFNRKKSEHLEAIRSEGKAKVTQIETLQEESAGLQDEERREAENRRVKEKALADLEVKIKDLRAEIARQQEADATDTPSYQSKLREKEALEAEIRTAQEGHSGAIETIHNEIDALIQDKEALVEAQAKVTFHKQGSARIEALKEQERNLAAEYERLEQELYLTEEFIRVKVNLLTEKINRKFKLAKFRLFESQINGGVVECCETLYNGVPYTSNLNNAARINVGLDIINTLSEHYGFEAPIWIDNAESVTGFIPVNTQMIKLIVSKNDKTLRVTPDPDLELKEAV